MVACLLVELCVQVGLVLKVFQFERKSVRKASLDNKPITVTMQVL
jgi:hypothetical protein